MFRDLLLTVALRMLPNEVLGLSTAAIFKNRERIKKLLTETFALVADLKSKGLSEDNATKVALDVAQTKRKKVEQFDIERAILDRGLGTTP